MISQPRIAVLGLSQPYVFIELAYGLLVVVVLGFEPYLRFELRFKPSEYLYIRTSTQTRIAILVFFNHYYLLTRLLSFACQEALSVLFTTRGVKCLRTLYSYQEVSLCLVSQVTLRSSTFASSIVYLAKSHVFRYITHLPKSGVRL